MGGPYFKMKKNEHRVEVLAEADVAKAIYAAQSLSQEMGFEKTARFMIATAVSELARNIFVYAGAGEVAVQAVEVDGKWGFEVIAEDAGPGIKDIALALKEGYSTGGTLGLGLPGVKRLMDEFYIDPERQIGTMIVARKWL